MTTEREPTTQEKIAALRIGAEAARANGHNATAQRLERSADVLEDPTLPPSIEERVAALEAHADITRLANGMALYAIVTLLGISPASVRQAAADVVASVSAPGQPVGPVGQAASEETAWWLERIAAGLESGRLSAFTSEVAH